jgi:hypothetical protein
MIHTYEYLCVNRSSCHSFHPDEPWCCIAFYNLYQKVPILGHSLEGSRVNYNPKRPEGELATDPRLVRCPSSRKQDLPAEKDNATNAEHLCQCHMDVITTA